MVTGFVVVCSGGCRTTPAVSCGSLLFGTFWWTATAGHGSTRRRMPAGRGAFTGTLVVLKGVGAECIQPMSSVGGPRLRPATSGPVTPDWVGAAAGAAATSTTGTVRGRRFG
uniref:(northern house mosquito) hypothetical protein n=1 Tax=Culex pipiens TaxID=7175 RepID=A0A8D8I314_CULPI